jgi:hypothetical protein
MNDGFPHSELDLIDSGKEPEQLEVSQAKLDCDVERVPDPLRCLLLLERSRDSWRRVARVFLGLSLLLFLFSCIQMWGTYQACKLLRETEDQTKRNRELVSSDLERIEEAHKQWQKIDQQLELRWNMNLKITKELEMRAREAKLREIEGWNFADELEKQRDTLKALEQQRREIERELKELRGLSLRQLAPSRSVPGHEPDKNCPAGLKRTVGEPADEEP